MIRKTHLSLLSFISLLSFSKAQNDSITRKTIGFFTDNVPYVRPFNAEYTNVSPYSYTSSLNGTELGEQKVENYQQVKANANLYFIKNKKWTLSTSLNYKYTTLETDFDHQKHNFHYHNSTLRSTYFSKLFNKTVFYSASVSVDGNEKGFEKFKGITTATLLLKANKKTKLAVGLIGLVGPSNRIPVIPMVTYEHKFDNGLVIDALLPQKVMLRKDVFQNSRISLGSEIESNSFYINTPDKTYEFYQIEIISGLTLEHKMGDFVGSFKTGLKTVSRAQMFEVRSSPKDAFYEVEPESAFFFNFGISYNPF